MLQPLTNPAQTNTREQEPRKRCVKRQYWEQKLEFIMIRVARALAGSVQENNDIEGKYYGARSFSVRSSDEWEAKKFIPKLWARKFWVPSYLIGNYSDESLKGNPKSHELEIICLLFFDRIINNYCVSVTLAEVQFNCICNFISSFCRWISVFTKMFPLLHIMNQFICIDYCSCWLVFWVTSLQFVPNQFSI